MAALLVSEESEEQQEHSGWFLCTVVQVWTLRRVLTDFFPSLFSFSLTYRDWHAEGCQLLS